MITSRAAVAAMAALGLAATVAAAPPTAAATPKGGTTVLTQKLDAPFGLERAREHRGLVVAEGDTGQVTRVLMDGRQRVILAGAPGVSGVATSPTRVFAVMGEGAPVSGKYGPGRLVRMDYNGKHVKVIANLLRHEKLHNPDGQVQYVDGKPVETLANPFDMTWSKFGLFVADGGANDVLRVNPRTGRVSTFFVPPTVKDVPGCDGPDANANPGTKGCDPVPTGVTVVGSSVYVSTLGAEVPGAGRIYKLNARTGKVQRVWKGFTAPTGIAVRTDGTIYISQVLHGMPQGEPGPDFSPADVGQITRIKAGKRTHAQVTMPTGLELKDGRLYASAWSIASFMGIPHAGQVVRVKDSAFE